jgi:beta-lactamase class D
MLKLCTAFLIFLLGVSQPSMAQEYYNRMFHQICTDKGGTVIYNYKNKSWIITDSAMAMQPQTPGYTFMWLHLLIALETGVIKDQYDTIRRTPSATSFESYKTEDKVAAITVADAFKNRIDGALKTLAQQIGKERYADYLTRCGYGNALVVDTLVDFWREGSLLISPVNQVEFMVKLFEEKLPVSKRTMRIFRRTLKTEQEGASTVYSLRSRTSNDQRAICWYTGYVQTRYNTCFFATCTVKPPNSYTFHPETKDIEATHAILRSIGGLDQPSSIYDTARPH